MSGTEIAKVYGEALFEAASGADRMAVVGKDLDEFTGAVRTTPELQLFFLSEQVSAEDKKRVLLDLTVGGDVLVQNFLRVLVDKGRESALEEIQEIYAELIKSAEGIVVVELVTARELPDETADELKKKLETSLGASVELTLTVDENILGGVKIQIGDRIADASLRHRLEQLRNRLVSTTASLEGSVEAES